MRLEDVLARIRQSEALEVLRPHWDDSVASLEDDVPFFLTAEEIKRNREWGGLSPETDDLLQKAAHVIREEPALRGLAWHCYRLLFEHTDYGEIKQWPSLEWALGELGGTFYLLIALAMVPRVLAVHQEMGVGPEVSRETCQQIACFSGNYRRMTRGRLGIPLSQLYWLRHYTAGRLFRIGRFEYMLRQFGANVTVYRHRESGHVLALAPDGVRYNRKGYVDGAAGVEDTEQGWTASLVEDDDAVLGYPISPCGYAVGKQVRLDKVTWECVLRKGDTTLEMHIPAGGGMSLARCGDSMRRAVSFFRQYFPDKPFKSISCASWIFNTQLQQLQLSSDNLARYQRELYLYPTRSSGQDGLWFIFFQNSFDVATAPRDTSLQRAVADFIAAGNIWRGGGMFFLTEHLSEFGAQYYRSHWPPPGLDLGECTEVSPSLCQSGNP